MSFSPQAGQTAISGVSPLRYFTIADSVTAAADLSQIDISDYELGITPACTDLETKITCKLQKTPSRKSISKTI